MMIVLGAYKNNWARPLQKYKIRNRMIYGSVCCDKQDIDHHRPAHYMAIRIAKRRSLWQLCEAHDYDSFILFEGK